MPIANGLQRILNYSSTIVLLSVYKWSVQLTLASSLDSPVFRWRSLSSYLSDWLHRYQRKWKEKIGSMHTFKRDRCGCSWLFWAQDIFAFNIFSLETWFIGLMYSTASLDLFCWRNVISCVIILCFRRKSIIKNVTQMHNLFLFLILFFSFSYLKNCRFQWQVAYFAA